MEQHFIEHFRVIRKLGAGGMGEVLLAEDTKLERKVAIKILPAELAQDAERHERFRTEAKAAATLNHPHVCVIHHVGETGDGRPFIAMEFIEGRSLDEVVREGPLQIGAVVAVGIQVADALDAAHANGVVHRDIKPANVSINDRGQVKVLDFGLAKRMLTGQVADPQGATRSIQTQAGTVLGTPSYMSPEQALGKETDHRTDLFSLGIVLYELVTGRVPFGGSSFGETVNNIVNLQPEAMARFNYNVTPELERITLKCLQKDVGRRYQSAKELLVDLENLKHDLQGGGAGIGTPVVGAETRTATAAEAPTIEEVKQSDIFISCARLDDQPLPPAKEGWISQFQRNLKVRLEQLSGEPVKIWSLPMPPGGEPVAEKLLEVLPEAKTMVSVVSPPFAKSQGACRGVEQFWQTAERSGRFWVDSKSRLFKVVKTPVDLQELPPRLVTLFEQLMGFEFYDRDPETGRIREFDESFGETARQRYHERIYDLAHEITHVLKTHQRFGTPSPSGTLAAPARTIYLAETTSELQPERDRLMRELIERGNTVLPARPLPWVASELEQTVCDYLDQCDLAIHLVGERYGLVPEDADRSVVALQNALAARRSGESDLQRLIWMPRKLQPRDDRQAAFVRELIEQPEAHRGAEVIEDTIENLKELLEERWRREERAAEKPKAPANGGVPRVYLICDREDETAVEPLEDFFYDQGVEVSLPDFEQDEAAVSRIHWQNLEDCDAVLVFYGAGGKSWVDIKLRDLIKAVGYRDGRAIALQAVYVAPPVDRRKERFKTLTAEVVRQCGEQFEPALLDAFVSRLKELKQVEA